MWLSLRREELPHCLSMYDGLWGAIVAVSFLRSGGEVCG